MSSLIKKILIFFSISFLLFFLTIISILWIYSNKLPDYKYLKSYKPPVSSKLYSGEGVLVSDFSAEKRIFVPFDSIPNLVINAFLSSEDKNNLDHNFLPYIRRLSDTRLQCVFSLCIPLLHYRNTRNRNNRHVLCKQ